jgi:hypothetical protein
MRVCQFRHFGTHVNVQRKRLDRQQFLVLQTLSPLSNIEAANSAGFGEAVARIP